MADLVAHGRCPEDRWRKSIPKATSFVIGRTAEPWATPWDELISRRHAELTWDGRELQVRRLPGSRNPIYVRGDQQDQFALTAGGHFVIGETTFTVTTDAVTIMPRLPVPVTEQAFTPQFLQRVPFRDADNRIDILSRAQKAFSRAADDPEMAARLVAMSFAGITGAVAVAVVRLIDEQGIDVLHWDRSLSSPGEFQPSEVLIRQSLATEQSVTHAWTDMERSGHSSHTVDWAFCTPFPTEACRGWALYVEGKLPGDGRDWTAVGQPDVREDIKFSELLVASFTNLRQARRDEQNRAHFRQFFSPVVLEAVARQGPEKVLAPRESDVAVLFCDLRGFSRTSEKAADDLFGLLQRVSDALGVTTRQILAHGGVVGDFHGDSAMGFWGWPFEQADGSVRACHTALAISREFANFSQQARHPLANFRIGIGIATGRAVAGKIGTVDQVKVSVFGPVVNLAARLEGMTKLTHAPILLDPTAAEAARKAFAFADVHVRRIAHVQPYGFESSFEISELLPAEQSGLKAADILAYEAALQSFDRGDWTNAAEQLDRLSDADQARSFLQSVIAEHQGRPPADWNGVIRMQTK